MPIFKKTKESSEKEKIDLIPVQDESPWYEYQTYLYSKKPTKDKMKQIEDSINIMLNKLNIKHSYNDWIEKKEYLTADQLQKIKNYNPNKTTTKKDIENLIKEVKNTKTKKIKTSGLKNITNILNLVSDIQKAPKPKKIETESIQDTINEVEKLLKTPKKDLKKLIKADKEHLKYHPSQQDYKEMKLDQKVYKHKVKDVAPHVAQYVAIYKDLLNKDNKGGARTRAIDKLRNAFMSVSKPSDIDDANALIREHKETLPKPEPKVKATKSKVKKEVVSSSYTDDAKYKPLTAYVKKNKPSITDAGDIHLIVCDLIDKKQRMSKKLLDSVVNDLGI
jgi:hypothetical protein